MGGAMWDDLLRVVESKGIDPSTVKDAVMRKEDGLRWRAVDAVDATLVTAGWHMEMEMAMNNPKLWERYCTDNADTMWQLGFCTVKPPGKKVKTVFFWVATGAAGTPGSGDAAAAADHDDGSDDDASVDDDDGDDDAMEAEGAWSDGDDNVSDAAEVGKGGRASPAPGQKRKAADGKGTATAEQKKPKIEMGPAASAVSKSISKIKHTMAWATVPAAVRQAVIDGAGGLDANGEAAAGVHAVRLQALQKLQRMTSAPRSNCKALWDDIGVRTVILRAVEDGNSSLREKGLGILKMMTRMANTPHAQCQSMWSEKRLPAALIRCLQDIITSPDDSSHRSVISVVELLSRKGPAAMRAEMCASDDFVQALLVLVKVVDQLKPVEISSVCMTLEMLVGDENPACRARIAAERGLLSAVYTLSTKSGDARTSAEGLLHCLLYDPTAAAVVLTDPTWHATLTTAATGASAVATMALDAIGCIARSCGDKMWKEAGLMSAVVDLVEKHPDDPQSKSKSGRVRLYNSAARILVELSNRCSAATQEAMWADTRTRRAIVASARCTHRGHEDCRDQSVGTLSNLACVKATAVAMGATEEVLDALVAGVAAKRSVYCHHAAFDALNKIADAVPGLTAKLAGENPGLVGITDTAAALPIRPKESKNRTELRSTAKGFLSRLVDAGVAGSVSEEKGDGGAVKGRREGAAKFAAQKGMAGGKNKAAPPAAAAAAGDPAPHPGAPTAGHAVDSAKLHPRHGRDLARCGPHPPQRIDADSGQVCLGDH
eukprot:m.172248 g.172248  ORF g.172248 m.172248 type:complete len:773 (-) comp24276_c0_seq1:272-2590(-)